MYTGMHTRTGSTPMNTSKDPAQPGRGVFVASPYPPGNSPCEPYQYDRRIFARQLSRSIFISKSPGEWCPTATMIVSAFKKLTSAIGGVYELGIFCYGSHGLFPGGRCLLEIKQRFNVKVFLEKTPRLLN